MQELREFFNNPCPSEAQKIKIRAPLTGGLRITKNDTINALNRREEHRKVVALSGTDYARDIKKREIETYLQNERERPIHETFESLGLDSMEELSSLGASTQNIEYLTKEAMTQVYSKYSFEKKEDTQNLAIQAYRSEIMVRIRAFPVLIIEGPTGCGKTTQVPQWILDDAYNSRKPCKIIVTQPRKIAAISIAKRVAQERGWDVGGVVGYQIGLENKTSSDTRIQYVTTGVLLQKLVSAKNMNEYTHVILDEVHERGQEMDFLLLIVKKLLYTVSPKVKVVLMSATLNSKTFAEYFSIPIFSENNTSSCVKITNERDMFTVKTFYLNNLNKFGNILQKVTPGKDPAIHPEIYHLVVNLIDAFERIDEGEEYTDRHTADLPSVLIFLPGMFEIEEQYACLMDLELRVKLAGTQCGKYKWWVLPLHSTITADEQVRVFQRAPPGHRKIILATNIAESSITVPDIKYVIDFCLTKILVADENTNFTSLQLRWASQTNCEQRAGRAGRVRDGRVYRLVNDKFYNELPKDSEPEIKRCPLERLILLAKMLNMGPPIDILALAMDPPDMSNIHRTVLVLKEIGALKKTLDDEWSNTDGDITYLGRMMAKLPINVRNTKLIVLGYIFGCLEECVIMAAGMSVKNVFSSPFRERLNAYNSKLTWADGSMSDCIAVLNVYKVWNHLRQQKHFRQQGNNEVHWARRFYVQVRSLRELDELVRELRVRCSREGIEALKGNSPWDKHEINLVLKVILAGAFYPQYFMQASTDEAREREAMRVLGGLDPRNTVYLKGFPDNQPGLIYASAIKNIIKTNIGDEPRVTFDKNSQKVYLTFQDNNNENLKNNKSGDPTIPGQVALPVYKAVKARHLKLNIKLPLLSVKKAEALANAYLKHSKDINKMVPRLPAIDDSYFRLKISQFVNVGKFWVQYDEHSNSNMSELHQIQVMLNRKTLLAWTTSIALDMLVAAPYGEAEGIKMYRARVTKLLPKDMVELLYIDYGSIGRVGSCSLRELPPGLCCDTPPLAMQCVLAGLAPAPLLHAHSLWAPAATRLFAELTSTGRLMGKIYSVTHGIVSIELLAKEGQINVNKELLDKGFAVLCEESYDSKLNHDLRQTATELNMAQKRAYNKEQAELAFSHSLEVASHSTEECISDVYLKGPNSPLESCLYNMMYSSRDKQVHVEWSSVNAVLLDTEPQEIYERLLVAGDVGHNQLSNNLTLRHTTLLPNIRGLPAIITLIFCPEAELRRNKEKTRYVSVLCGLGCNEYGSPHFPEHDLLVNIDADLSVNDIEKINHIRYLMEYTMSRNDEGIPPSDDDFRLNVPKSIRVDLMAILQTRRKHREPETVVNAWDWKSAPQDDLLELTFPEMESRSRIYPFHVPLELYPMSRDKLLALKRNNEELKVLVSRSTLSSTGSLECKLCSTPPMPMHAMRIHLCSNSHQEKEEDFRHIQT